MTTSEIAAKFDAKRSGKGWAARCPAHDDRNASLSIGTGRDGRVLLKCHAGCTTGEIQVAAGLAMADLMPASELTVKPKGLGKPVAIYNYNEADGSDGTLRYQVLRYVPKDFRQRRPDGHGGWLYNLNGVKRLVYRADRLAGNDAVFVCEGERDVETLVSLGVAATCNSGGAGKWTHDHAEQLRALGVKRVAVPPDNDETGRDHAEIVAHTCHAVGIEARIVAMAGLPEKGDVTDYIELHGKGAFLELVKAAPPWTPDSKNLPEVSGGSEPDAADPVHLEALVVAEMDRERARREARRRLAAEERGTIPQPEIVTLRERLARPRVPSPWRIARWQPRDSRVMLAAQYKAGKTTIVGGLVRCLVDDDLHLGCAAVTPVTGTVALLDTEMSAGQLEEWLGAQRIKHDDRVVVIPLRGRVAAFNLLDADVRGEWALRLRAWQVEYLILDCLRPVLDALGLDEHRDAGRFLTAFDALIVEAVIPDALVVTHMGHTNERARGDSRLRDWPDVEWRLVRQDDAPASARFISAYGRDVDVPESALTFDPATRHLTIAGGSRDDAKTAETLTDVINVLRASDNPLSVRGIQAALVESDHPRDRVRKAIKLGVETQRLTAEPGPKGAILHQACERAEACGERAAHSASECAAASIEAAHSHAHDQRLEWAARPHADDEPEVMFE